MRTLSLLIFVLFSIPASAQKKQELEVQFVPTYGNKEVQFDEAWYTLPSGDSIIFEVFKCYISDLCLYSNDKKVFTEKDSYHLISNEGNMQFSLMLPHGTSFDAIRFNLGIDSATSNSGALGGDLDPAKGMFWTWQSGYINCKIEGRSNLCPTRHHAFEFHLGGYAAPYCAMQQVKLPVKQNHTIRVEVPLDKFIAGLNLKKQHSIMSPGADAVTLSKLLAKTLQSKQ